MEISQGDIDLINIQLLDTFGQMYDISTWRIVWSEDQFEDHYGTFNDFTEGGIFIRQVTERRRIPKYRQWIHEKWILERIVVVPLDNIDHPTIDTSLSYEVIYVFENNLPPIWVAVRFIIENIYENMRQQNTGPTVKYKDPDIGHPDDVRGRKEEEIKDIEEALFGNETELGDALAYKQGVGYTGPPKIKLVKR